MVKKPSSCCDDEVGRVGKVSSLLAEAGATEDTHTREVRQVLSERLQHAVALGCELSCWLEHQVAHSRNRCSLDLALSDPFLENRQEVGGSLSTSSHCVSKDVISFEDGRDYRSLNHCRMLEVKVLSSFGERFGDEELME